MASDEEFSVLEYARFHGLAKDHTKLNPLEMLPEPLPERYPDHSHLPPFGGFKLEYPEPDRFTASKSDLRHLVEFLKPPPMPDYRKAFPTRCERIRDLNIEPPMLRTDEDVDLIEYHDEMARLRKRILSPDLAEIAPLDEPATVPSFEGARAEVERAVYSEKWQASKEDLLYLQQCLKRPDKESVQRGLEELLKVHIPSSTPSSRMPSDHGNEMVENAMQKSNQIEEKTTEMEIVCNATPEKRTGAHEAVDNTCITDFAPETSIEEASLSLVSAEEARTACIEVPQTPARSCLQPGGNFSTPGVELEKIPSSMPAPEELSAHDIDQLFHDTDHATDEATMDTKLQIPIKPRITEGLDVPAASESDLPTSAPKASASEGTRTRQAFPEKVHNEGGARRIDLTEKAQKLVQELSILDKDPKKYASLEQLGKSVCQSPNVYAKSPMSIPVRNILGPIDYNYEALADRDLSTSSDLPSLLKKRKMTIQGKEGSVKRRSMAALDHKERMPFPSKDSYRPMFSPTGAIGDFFTARAGHQEKDSLANQVFAFTSPLANFYTGDQTAEDEPDEQPKSTTPSMQMFLPSIPASSSKIRGVLSSTVIPLRSLIRTIHQLCPLVEFVERDFEETRNAQKSAVSYSPPGQQHNIIRDEADIIVSPSTGLVLTTMQKLHQKPLPGSKQPQALQARLALLAPRYEVLCLIVSQNLSKHVPSAALTASDCAAVAEITSFTRSPYFKSEGTKVSVILSIGGEECLARWVVALMAQNSAEPSKAVLKQEETPWEIWLRRLGMNAFAAQAVLYALDTSTSTVGDKNSVPHLARFVHLQASERTKLLSGVLDPLTINRINRLLDAQWA